MRGKAFVATVVTGLALASAAPSFGAAWTGGLSAGFTHTISAGGTQVEAHSTNGGVCSMHWQLSGSPPGGEVGCGSYGIGGYTVVYNTVKNAGSSFHTFEHSIA